MDSIRAAVHNVSSQDVTNDIGLEDLLRYLKNKEAIAVDKLAVAKSVRYV